MGGRAGWLFPRAKPWSKVELSTSSCYPPPHPRASSFPPACLHLGQVGGEGALTAGTHPCWDWWWSQAGGAALPTSGAWATVWSPVSVFCPQGTPPEEPGCRSRA